MSEPDVKSMRAAIAVAEHGSFSRAAIKLRITQSGLTKQILSLEAYLGHSIFSRAGKTILPTRSGEVFLAEAKLSIEHQERAIRLSRAVTQQVEIVLHVGKSPYTDPYLMTQMLSLNLPLFPKLRIELTTKFANDLASDILNGTLDLAFLTGVPASPRLTSVLVSNQTFFVAMLETDHLALSKQIGSHNLATSSCIVFEKHVHPLLYDEVRRLAQPATGAGCILHHVMTAEDASHLVLRGLGVAVLTQAGAWRIARNGITIRPLIVDGLWLETRLTCRSENQSRVVRDFVRTFMTMIRGRQPERQLGLALGN